MRLASLESGWVVGIWEFFGWNFELQLSGKNSCPNECGHVFGSDFRWIFCRCSSRMLRHDFRWDSESEVELRPELGICSRSLGNKIQDGEMYVMIVSSYLHMCVHIYIYIYISKDLYIYIGNTSHLYALLEKASEMYENNVVTFWYSFIHVNALSTSFYQFSV